jgi:hypothetical protein
MGNLQVNKYRKEKVHRVSSHCDMPSLRLGIALCLMRAKVSLKKDNGSLHIHIISIKDQTVPFIPDVPAASHKNFFETSEVVSPFAIKKNIKNGKLSIPF